MLSRYSLGREGHGHDFADEADPGDLSRYPPGPDVADEADPEDLSRYRPFLEPFLPWRWGLNLVLPQCHSSSGKVPMRIELIVF